MVDLAAVLFVNVFGDFIVIKQVGFLGLFSLWIMGQ
jgi:hypothetical protein